MKRFVRAWITYDPPEDMEEEEFLIAFVGETAKALPQDWRFFFVIDLSTIEDDLDDPSNFIEEDE